MKRISKLAITIILLSFVTPLFAQENLKVATYFTGIGCPHCEKISPEIHQKIENKELLLIEYEIYQNSMNAPLLQEYKESYNGELGIPQIFWNEREVCVGDTDISDDLEDKILCQDIARVYLQDGTSVQWEDFNLNDLNGYPKIYFGDRVAIRESIQNTNEEDNTFLKNFLTTDTLETLFNERELTTAKTKTIQYPGGETAYEYASKIGGWLIQWNEYKPEFTENITTDTDVKGIEDNSISWLQVLSLALADSVNPCALAILTTILIAITTYNPKDRKQILYSGLAFVAAVVVMYLIYGILIVKAFELVQNIGQIKNVLYIAMSVLAIILGLLEIKDFFFYKEGGFLTEMPVALRPKMRKLVSKVTTPIGAFTLGLFVTLFLLPCTIGPYVILGGMISDFGLIQSLPKLFVYNLIFVLPMIIVTLLVFFGTKSIDDISDWKDKNVRYLHLFAGIIITILGIWILFSAI